MDERTKRDLLNIMKLSVRKDIRSEEVLKKLIKISETTDNFNSPVGKVFIDRIKKILHKSEEKYSCIICKKNDAINGIICKSCMDVYNRQVNKIKSNDVQKDISVKKVEISSSKRSTAINNSVYKTNNNRTIKTNGNNNEQQGIKKKYKTSILGTFMYTITAFINKRVLKKKQAESETYQKPVSGHVFIGWFTILCFGCYLFSIYAGFIMLCIGIVILLYNIIKKISHFKMESLGMIILSIVFWPLGLILLGLGIFKKLGYLYQNRKYIGSGFALYGIVAYMSATMFEIPGHFCAPGIVGYYNMIFLGDYGTRWDRTVSGALTEMTIFLVSGIICTILIIGAMSVYLDEVEEYCCNRGLSKNQAFMKMLQSPIEVLLMFAPLLLFIFCKTETLESSWSLDIDNNTHEVSDYMRFRNGKWEYVNAYERRNPDDIINNNLSYKGNNPYNGSNPIRNNRRR